LEILIIDGQGGGIGKALIERLRLRMPEAYLIAAGTNAMATAAMLKAGAHIGATGENAICVNAARADVIIGPIGIVLADAMCGELTPAMARSVGQSNALRILIPVSRCHTVVAGVEEKSAGRYLDDAVEIAVRHSESQKAQK
jgi:hypothetical protein